MKVGKIGKYFVKQRFCPWNGSVLSRKANISVLAMEEGPNKG